MPIGDCKGREFWLSEVSNLVKRAVAMFIFDFSKPFNNHKLLSLFPPIQWGVHSQLKQKTNLSTKQSKLDLLSSLIRNEQPLVQTVTNVSDDDLSDDDDIQEVAPKKTLGFKSGKILLRPSEPPPPVPPARNSTEVSHRLEKLDLNASNLNATLNPMFASADENSEENMAEMLNAEQNRSYFLNPKTGGLISEKPSVRNSKALKKISRGSDSLGKQLQEKKLKEKQRNGDSSPHNDDVVDVFGRDQSGRNGDSVGSNSTGSQSSTGRRSLRSTLSKALGFGGSKKTSVLRDSDSNEPSSRAVLNPAQIPLPYIPTSDEREATSSSGSSLQASLNLKPQGHSSKHIEVVAEVHTKKGTHQIVRSKQPKKHHHSDVLTHIEVPSDVLIQPMTSHYQLQQQQQHFTHQQAAVAQQPHCNHQHPYAAAQAAQQYSQAYPQQIPQIEQLQQPPRPQQFTPQFQQQLFEKYVQAVYDFFPNDPVNTSEIVVRRGDVLQLVEQGDDGWWEGINVSNGSRGLFPGSHVQFLS